MISVVIPSLNEERCIAQCIESVKRNGVAHEIIVVDGGSKDKTVAIAKRLADKVLHEGGRGPAAARNFGAKHAEYPVVAFIDSDCVAHEKWLHAIAEDFRNARLIGAGGVLRPLNARLVDGIMFKLNSDWCYRVTASLGFCQFSGSNCAYRKKDFLALGGFNTALDFFEDTDLSLRASRRGRVLCDKRMIVYASARRFQQKGYTSVFLEYMAAYWNYFVNHKVSGNYFNDIEK
jgi:glycosyltransferase involved in cell wall biosynthesis